MATQTADDRSVASSGGDGSTGSDTPSHAEGGCLLVAVNESKECERCIGWLTQSGVYRPGMDVVLLHVLFDTTSSTAQRQAMKEAAERTILDRYALRLAMHGIHFRLELTSTGFQPLLQDRRAALATALVTFADAVDADAIVLGSQPRGLVDRILRGPGAPLTVAQCCERMTERQVVQRVGPVPRQPAWEQEVLRLPSQRMQVDMGMLGGDLLNDSLLAYQTPFVLKSQGYQDVVMHMSTAVA